MPDAADAAARLRARVPRLGLFHLGPAAALFRARGVPRSRRISRSAVRVRLSVLAQACAQVNVLLVPGDLFYYRVHAGQEIAKTRQRCRPTRAAAGGVAHAEFPDCPLTGEESRNGETQLRLHARVAGSIATSRRGAFTSAADAVHARRSRAPQTGSRTCGRRGVPRRPVRRRTAARLHIMMASQAAGDRRRRAGAAATPAAAQAMVRRPRAARDSGGACRTNVAGDGAKGRELERLLRASTGARGVLALNSCTAALEIAITSPVWVAGDEVILPSYTFVSTSTPSSRPAPVPMFADIDPVTLGLDPADVARRITPKTRALMPMHYARHGVRHGRADGDRRTAHGLLVIEDAAHAVNAACGAQALGTIGALGALVISRDQGSRVWRRRRAAGSRR